MQPIDKKLNKKLNKKNTLHIPEADEIMIKKKY